MKIIFHICDVKPGNVAPSFLGTKEVTKTSLCNSTNPLNDDFFEGTRIVLIGQGTCWYIAKMSAFINHI